ncbi:MAG: hypothetical protein K1X74_13850 [Pirellulales bacterium]|nr:hypothetical protein [Pirellulales bacterium]
MMSRRTLLLAALASVFGAALFGGALAGGFWALRQQPEFYAASLLIDESRAKQASDDLLRQVAAVTSAAHQRGAWQAVFTAEQINGWLAYDVRKNHPRLLPKAFGQPRIAIDNDHATIACRYRDGSVDTVLSLEVRLYLTQPGEVALQVCRARAGWLPLPLGKVLDEVEKAAAEGGWRLRWLQSDGQPVAAVQIVPNGEESTELVLEEAEIRDGALWVAGSSRAPGSTPALATQPGEKTNRQR